MKRLAAPLVTVSSTRTSGHAGARLGLASGVGDKDACVITGSTHATTATH